MSIMKIKNNWDNNEYKNKMDYPKNKYKEGHIFDENQSVKWNKEEVIRHNELIDIKKKEYQAESNRLNSKLWNDVVEALMEDYNFNKAQAEKIWSFAYAEKHSYMGDTFGYAEELADLVSDIIMLSNVKDK